MSQWVQSSPVKVESKKICHHHPVRFTCRQNHASPGFSNVVVVAVVAVVEVPVSGSKAKTHNSV